MPPSAAPRTNPREAPGRDGGAPPASASPIISLPKGGGAIRGIGEKFAANPVTGTGSMTVPIATSPGRSGFGPQLSLSYDSGAGNGPFGFGWSLSLPAITRKTDKGLAPVSRRRGVRRLHPLRRRGPGAGPLTGRQEVRGSHHHAGFHDPSLPPRIEGLFARIERWTKQATGEIHWRSITRDNVTTLYGKTAASRIADPGRPDARLQLADLRELRRQGQRHRLRVRGRERRRTSIVARPTSATAMPHGQPLPEAHQVRQPRLAPGPAGPDRSATWLFEVVFDYDEGHYEELDSRPGTARRPNSIGSSAPRRRRRGPGRSARTRSPRTAPGSRCAPTAAAAAC